MSVSSAGVCGLEWSGPFDVASNPQCQSGFVERTSSKCENRVRGRLFGRREAISIYLKEERADKKSRPFVSVEKRVVADNASHVGGGHLRDVCVFIVCAKVPRPGEGGFQKSRVAQAFGASFQGKKTSMDRQGIALVDPKRFFHLARACRVLRYRRMMSSAFFIFFSKVGS